MSFPEAVEPEPDDPRNDVVLITDASVEGEEVTGLLRARGFTVLDVPLGLLDSHFTSAPPRVLILDVDQPRAIETGRRLRAGPGGLRVTILCVGDPLRSAELFIGIPGSGGSMENVFERPVDIQRLADRVGAFASPSGLSYSARGTTPPPMYMPRASLPPPQSDSVPPISDFPRTGDPLDGNFLLSLDDGEGIGPVGVLSPDLAETLARAERRVANTIDRLPPPPNDDPDCVLPLEMLAPLDEPLDPLEEELGTGSGGVDGTGAPQMVAWVEGVSSSGTGAGTGTGALVGVSPAAITSSGIPFASLGARSPILPGAMHSQFDGASVPRSPADLGPMTTNPAASSQRGHESIVGSITNRMSAEPSYAQSSMNQRAASSTSAELMATIGPAARSQAAAAHVRLADLALPVETAAAPVRFQEARVVGEGRASMALAFEDRLHSRDEQARPPPLPEALGSSRGRPIPEQRKDITNADAPRSTEPRRAPVTRTASDGERNAKDSGNAMPMVFAEMEGGKPLARSIAGRFSGSLAFSSSAGVRRIVLQDGDVITAGSEIADESLVSFLAGRGDIDREAAGRLAGKLPPSGRHAGAALIAQGFLAQDDLWPVLRSHAEWLIGKAIVAGPGTVEPEEEAPGRLKAEPSVFGGATGAEVFVEMIRRVVPASFALAQLGGPLARFDQGKRANLLGECALPDPEQAAARGAPGRTPVEISPDGESDLITALWALVELGVLGVTAPARPSTTSQGRRAADPLDDEAIRQRVRARLSIVREGDYFSLLGVTRVATSYEIKRAYLELRRTFEPSVLLTAATADLLDDVQLVVEVLDEAYEILRDTNRRDRYRRAIDAVPMD